MKLSVYERMILLNILPPEGDLTTIAIMRKLRESLSFDEHEHAELNIRVGMDWSGGCPRCGGKEIEYPGENLRLDPDRRCTSCKFEGAEGQGKAFWNRKADKEREIEIQSKAFQIIQQRLQELNKAKMLREEHELLCHKFEVGNE